MSYSVVILQGKQATHFILLPSPNHQSVSVFYCFCVFLSLTQSLRQSTDSAIRTSVSSYTCPGWFGLVSEAVSVISYEDSASNLTSGPPAGTSIFLGIPYFSQPSGSPAPYSKALVRLAILIFREWVSVHRLSAKRQPQNSTSKQQEGSLGISLSNEIITGQSLLFIYLCGIFDMRLVLHPLLAGHSLHSQGWLHVMAAPMYTLSGDCFL